LIIFKDNKFAFEIADPSLFSRFNYLEVEPTLPTLYQRNKLPNLYFSFFDLSLAAVGK
jgi:hypothetical protein